MDSDEREKWLRVLEGGGWRWLRVVAGGGRGGCGGEWRWQWWQGIILQTRTKHRG
ncbi:hypothetical protein HanRHA438_Chr05g0229171 [Helianthus annuus]|nr:hypothetical protein HanIR_Chr05g0236861 [Helianthus annuus]KAJ0919397.1 hypothetical protein HanRHA438_Chr05g0229171 [Helianthus annuus]